MLKLLRAVWRLAPLFGVVITAVSSIIAIYLFLGGKNLGPLETNRLLMLTLGSFIFFLTCVIIRYEILIIQYNDFFDNPHKKALLNDGIYPLIDTYLDYVKNGDFSIVHKFWLAGIVNVSNSYGESDLHVACMHGHAAMAVGIIERGGDLKKTNRMNMTPLALAIERNHTNVVVKLLDYDVDVNFASGRDGVTPLYAAAVKGDTYLVSLLLRAGAKIDQPDVDNITPAMASILAQKWDTVRQLFESGAGLTRRDRYNATMMDYALARQAPEDILNTLNHSGIREARPRLVTVGDGSSYTGKQTIQWELAEDATERLLGQLRSDRSNIEARIKQLEADPVLEVKKDLA